MQREITTQRMRIWEDWKVGNKIKDFILSLLYIRKRILSINIASRTVNLIILLKHHDAIDFLDAGRRVVSNRFWEFALVVERHRMKISKIMLQLIVIPGMNWNVL